MNEADKLAKAVEDFLKDADMTPPWKSVETVWLDMCLKLNEALATYKDSRE